ncbi:MAG TPA: hypothetical protein DCS07_13315, partial [Bdellovibrionales bacterium]|nr:hypothetical protein [Bdellovibrionales bacterium]
MTVSQTAQNYSALIINSSDCDAISSKLPLTLVSSGSAAKTALMDSKRRFAGIFIDPVMPYPGGVELIGLAHRYRPVTPVYVLYRKNKPFTEAELDRMGVHGQLQTPISAPIIQKRIASQIFDYWFDLPAFPQITESSEEDRLYTAVLSSDLLTGSASLYDIHVRLPSGRYFKILNARDTLSPERVLGYIQKGVGFFYFKKADHELCLSYCDNLAKFLISHHEVSFELRASALYNQGQKLINGIHTEGLTAEHIDFAVLYVGQIRSFITRMDIDNLDEMRTFLAHLSLYDRSVSTAMIAGLLALPLKVESESAFRAIGLAALLHDIGMLNLPEDRYFEHPAIGARMLADVPGIDAVSIQAIEQHHERRDNTGFPGRVNGSNVNRIAELIGLSDEFINLLEAAGKNPALNPL